MNWIFYAKGQRGLEVLKSVLKNKLAPRAIVLEKEDQRFISLCIDNNIEIIICSVPKENAHIEKIKLFKPELILMAGYSKIMPPKLLDFPNHGVINCHGGKLPEYRGASPVPWQIINGETKGAAYILQVKKGVDDGPVIAEQAYDILPEDTATDLTGKISAIFAEIVPQVLEEYAKGSPPTQKPQEEANAAYWTRRVPEDGKILWEQMTAREVVNLVRGLTPPYPGAFTVINGQKVVFHKVIVHPLKICGVPGRYVGRKSDYPTIICKDRSVGIERMSINNNLESTFPAQYGDDCEL